MVVHSGWGVLGCTQGHWFTGTKTQRRQLFGTMQPGGGGGERGGGEGQGGGGEGVRVPLFKGLQSIPAQVRPPLMREERRQGGPLEPRHGKGLCKGMGAREGSRPWRRWPDQAATRRRPKRSGPREPWCVFSKPPLEAIRWKWMPKPRPLPRQQPRRRHGARASRAASCGHSVVCRRGVVRGREGVERGKDMAMAEGVGWKIEVPRFRGGRRTAGEIIRRGAASVLQRA